MIRRAKELELMKICFYNPFEHVWFKSVFDLKNYGFWSRGFNKSYSYIYVTEASMHNIHDIKSIGSQMYLYLKCSAKWGIQNIEF
jgi:hypothetical protein